MARRSASVAVVDYWLQHADRPTAIGFTIDPAGDLFVDGRLNLWQGFSVKPKEGDWSRLREHILDVICGGNKEHAAYLLRYLAYKFQNPTTQSEVIIVLRGKQGTGKGTLATLMCELFGAHGLQISDRRHLVGNFNAHLLQTCFLFADEAFWAGDKQAEGTFEADGDRTDAYVRAEGARRLLRTEPADRHDGFEREVGRPGRRRRSPFRRVRRLRRPPARQRLFRGTRQGTRLRRP